ncbi:MAG: protein phosphatase CheZ [Rickettsiales bacterium]
MADTIKADVVEKELRKLAEFIVAARRELLSINAEKGENKEKNLALASMELSEVVRHTEEATNKIMDETDAIQKLCAVFTEQDVAKAISTHAFTILETCSFQDITGQRIKKVMRTLEEIEIRVGKMVTLFGGDLPEGMYIETIKTGRERPDEHLMEGPQMTGKAKSQAEVDKLFNES